MRLRLKAVRRRARRRRKQGHPVFWGLFKIGFAAVLLWSFIGLGYYAWALTFDLSQVVQMPERSVVYDREGKPYSRLHGENRILVDYDQVSPFFVEALITREDTRFFTHHGIDPVGIARAAFRNLVFGGIREGASTITQQLARNTWPLGGRNLHRKLIEAALSFRIETELAKEQILQCYMNRIYFGSGCYGIEAASQTYFGKPAAKLSLPEAALLAGIIRSPSKLTPFRNPKGALKARDSVLRRMAELDFISRKELEAGLKTKLVLNDRRPRSLQQNWAMETILDELEMALPREIFEEGGLKIYTTVDAPLQHAAAEAVEGKLSEIEARAGYTHPRKSQFSGGNFDSSHGTPYLQAAALVLDNRTGGIRAIIGGRDYSQSKYHRAVFAERQVGSAVKPFVYAAAFDAGLQPDDTISDARITPGELPKKYGLYDPANADDEYRPQIHVADGLIGSRNPATVRVGMRAGIDRVGNLLSKLAVSTDAPRFPSLFLGTFEATLKDLTAAYTIFATDGVKLQPFILDRVVDSSGVTVFRATKGRIRILPPGPARLTAEAMEGVMTRGTASSSAALGLRQWAAGKTGTTDDYLDAWFVGCTRSVTCGVWVGFDSPKPIMKRGYASTLALPVWVEIVERAR